MEKTLVDQIIEHLEAGGVVQISTYMHSHIYDGKKYGSKLSPLFKNGKDGEPLVKQGKRFVSFKGSKVQFGHWKEL